MIVVDRANDPFIERIKAEIATLGLQVITRGPVGTLEANAREQHAIAAIRVLPSRQGVEVWMADEVSGRPLLRQLVVDERPAGPDHRLVALQTAELLRTSFFPKSSQPPAAASQPVATPPVVIVQRAGLPVEPGVQAGFGFLGSAGGTGTALQVWLSLRLQLGSRIGMALDLSGPARRADMSGPEGGAKTASYLAGGALFARFERNAPGLFLTTGLGAAFAWLSARGQGTLPLLGTSATAFTGLGYARLDAGWRPLHWLGFGITAVAGATFDQVVVRFAGNEAATWGWPVWASFVFGQIDWR
ncbi:MAG: hypothetical protein JXP73_21765 [Deltaproteobacteria bacterium]|nr:hypothetical protein [Deltaproteobacteria bacterium]